MSFPDSRFLTGASLPADSPAGTADAAGFYVTGGTLPANAASYMARQADHDLWDALERGEFCYVLNTRQMGKSSLMVRTARRLRQAGVRVAVMDLTALGQNVTPTQWYDGLLSALAEQLHLEDAMEDFWLENAKLGPLQRFITAIRQVALPRVPQPLVVFIDEIDAVRSLPFPVDELFAAIRECYNRRRLDPEYEKLTFCLLGVAAPTDLIRDTRISPFNIGRRIALADFTPQEAAPLAAGLPGGKKMLDRVLHWTGGHPYMTQRLCRTLAEQNVTMPAGVDDVCRQLFLSRQAQDTDDNLAFVRNRLLRSEVDVAALLDLYLQVRRGRRVRDDEMNPLCGVLRLSGAAKASRGVLRVRNRIYDHVFDPEWVRAHMPDAELRRQRAAYRRGVLRTGAIAAVVVLLMSLLTGWALRERSATQTALRQAQRNERLAERNAYAADMNLVQNNWQENVSEVHALLQETQSSPYRGVEWGFWNWLLPRKSELMTLAGHNGPVSAAAFSPDGRRIVTNSYDSVVRVWDADTGRSLFTLQSHGLPTKFSAEMLHPAAFSPDGKRIVTGSDDNTARVWDAGTGRPLLTLTGHTGLVTSAAFSPDSKRIVTGSEDHTARIWDAGTGRALLPPLTGHGGSVNTAAFSPDSKRIVTGSEDRTARVWDANTGRALLPPLTGHGGLVNTAAFSPDGGRIVTASADYTARVWDANTGRALRTLTGHRNLVNTAAFSPDGRRIVTGSADGTARVWDAGTGKSLPPLTGHGGAVAAAAFSPDGRRIVTGSLDGTAKVWDADISPAPQPLTLQKHDSHVSSVAFSPDGGRIVIGSNDGFARVRYAGTGKLFRALRGHGGSVFAAAFSPDGGRIVTGNMDSTAKVWDAGTGKPLRTLRGHGGTVWAAAFSPDGGRIVTGSDDGFARVWDAGTGKPLRTLRGHGAVRSASFSPDGRRIVTGSDDGLARVWEASTGRPLLMLQGHGGSVFAAAFSPDGGRIVTGNMDSTAKVWDANTGQALPTLRGHGSAVITVTFSPDGGRIVTGSVDSTVRVWDADTGQALLTFDKAFTTAVYSVAFSPDGRRLVTGTYDGAVEVWFSNMDPAQAAQTVGKE